MSRSKNLKIAAVLFVLCGLNFFLSASCILRTKADPHSGQDPLIVLEQGQATQWKQQTDLNIFANPRHRNKQTIDPFSQGVYHFSVGNSGRKPLQYVMQIVCQNKDRIPLEFRLKKRGVYIAGTPTSWVSSLQMDSVLQRLSGRQSDRYMLEWRWASFSDHSDTALGMEAVSRQVAYILTISITAQMEESSSQANGPHTGIAFMERSWMVLLAMALCGLTAAWLRTQKQKAAPGKSATQKTTDR